MKKELSAVELLCALDGLFLSHQELPERAMECNVYNQIRLFIKK